MCYDTNISSRYLKQDIQHLDESEYQGFCVNVAVKPGDLKSHVYSVPALGIKKSLYSRLEVEFDDGSQVNYEQRSVMKSDLFVIKLGDTRGLDKLIKLHPDMITFNYTAKPLLLKHGLIRTAIKENIFFEIPLRESLYRDADGVMWMRNVRKLLDITRGRNTVVSSGATCFTEIKKPEDIIEMLKVFRISRKRAKAVLNNSERLLRGCAMKRYCYKDTIVHDGDEGLLKRDFILSCYEQ